MKRSFRPLHAARSLQLVPYQRALDRIDAFLARTNPDFERAKMEESITLMFGPRPTSWIIDPPPDAPFHTS